MNIYFSGIGGVGIGPLAEIAMDAGYSIVGSDLADSLMTKQLREKGVEISLSQDGTFLREKHNADPIDWFVYTSALPEHHPELIAAREQGIRTAKRDELLAYIIDEKKLKLIAIAGTHGKTTTTGMMIWVFKQLNIPVSYSIGTTLSFGPSGKLNSSSEYFIYECDEFDKNFLHFHPYLSLLTSIDYDHPDSYPTETDYLNAFKDFASQSRRVITWNDQHAEIFAGLDNVTTLDSNNADAGVLKGEHNRKNATLIKEALRVLGLPEATDDILASFPGVDRRFEKLAENLYSDYGHHPVEIAATLEMAREISDHVVLVYQPHQNIRQNFIKDQYTDQFEKAEVIYWLPTYLSREDPNLPVLQPEGLIKNITNRDNVRIADFNDQLWSDIQDYRHKGYLVVCMGAGKIDEWVRKQLAARTTPSQASAASQEIQG